MELHSDLLAIKKLLKGLSAMLGDRYEVILHDLSYVERSIVGLEGSVTNRKIGGPSTNYLLQLLKEYGDDAPDSINYKNVLSDGRVLRSSTIFIRDSNEKIIGSLCINQDLTDFMVAHHLLQEAVTFNSAGDNEEHPKELFAQEISEVMETIVDMEIEHVSKPITYMQKEDKLLLVDRLEKKGIFDVKNSVEYIAARLGVTNFTIYNYLKEIRGKSFAKAASSDAED